MDTIQRTMNSEATSRAHSQERGRTMTTNDNNVMENNHFKSFLSIILTSVCSCSYVQPFLPYIQFNVYFYIKFTNEQKLFNSFQNSLSIFL